MLKNWTPVNQLGWIRAFGQKFNKKMSCVPFDQRSEDILASGVPTCAFVMHAESSAWLQFVPTWCDALISLSEKRGTAIVPFSFHHKAMPYIPILGVLAAHFRGNSVSTYCEMMEILQDKSIPSMFMTCPEGINCNFEYAVQVAPFKNFGLIKGALEAGCPLCVVSFKLDTRQSIPVKLPFMHLFKDDSAIGVRLPFIRPSGISMMYEIIDPPVTANQFADMDDVERRASVQEAANMIRKTMLKNYDLL